MGFLSDPLRRALKDEDPYVRKTAAIAVAKLYDLTPELTEKNGFIKLLVSLLSDKNPMVIANATAALSEIQETSNKELIILNPRTINTLITALGECSEWGKIYILDALINIEPKGEKEAKRISERIAPYLIHGNTAVKLSGCRVILKMLDHIKSTDSKILLLKKIVAPLKTLLNSQPEIQYIALRNINLIVQKYPKILENDIKVFFCKYNDPIYVKLEKLDIMIKLCTSKNISIVLSEFKEYSSEVDIDFVRRSVRAIGRCAIKIDVAAQDCVDVLCELIKTKINYVVQEGIIVIKDIFRKYPNKYESIIGTLCENLDTLDEPEAKASLIWIIGEYSKRIENADELLEVFLDTFHDEATQVQLQLLTATVKLFLNRPKTTEELLTNVLKEATKESDNPDLRDRGYVYWRLLSADAKVAKQVVLSEKPTIRDDSTKLSPKLLNELLLQIPTLASVYHKPPQLFIPNYNVKKSKIKTKNEIIEEEEEEKKEEIKEEKPKKNNDIGDLLDFGNDNKPKSNNNNNNNILDIDDMFGDNSTSTSSTVKKSLLLDSNKGKGLKIEGSVNLNLNLEPIYYLTFTNESNNQLGPFYSKFNSNTFGIKPSVNGPMNCKKLNPNESENFELPLSFNGQPSNQFNTILQVAIKSNNGVIYFKDNFRFNITFLNEEGKVDKQLFVQNWKTTQKEHKIQIDNIKYNDTVSLKTHLEKFNVHFIAKHTQNHYFSVGFKCRGKKVTILTEISINSNSANISSKTSAGVFLPLFEEEIKKLLTN